jgi:putative hydrolase of the HAD superfamily
MAERPRLEAVLFDAGGTLIRLDYEWIGGTVRALGHEITTEALRRGEVMARRAFEKVFHLPPPEDEAAAAPVADHMLYFRVILEAAGVPQALVAPALERIERRNADPGMWTRAAEGARSCLDALPLLGLRIACVSNSDGRAEQHLAACDMRRGLEFVVDSEKVGVAKPDPAIFRIALERLGLPPARVLYVGDLRVFDGGGARAAGMPFVIIDPYGDYAVDGEPAIETIGRLPAWLAANYALGASRRA